MKSFKYKGTPEQMAKVAEWALKNGYTWYDEDRDGEFLLVDGDNPPEIFYSDGYARNYFSPMPPDLELEIFGSTQGITGNPENKPAEEYFVQPKTEKFLEDAHDSLYTDVEYEADMVVKQDIVGEWFDNDRRSEPRNKYMREIKPGVFCDVYDVLRAFEVTDGALQHLIKKALCPGKRLHKDELTDLKDIVASSQRALDIYLEWNT